MNFLKLFDPNYTLSPDLGESAVIDQFPGVSDTDLFRSPDPDIPAIAPGDDDLLTLLRRIARNTDTLVKPEYSLIPFYITIGSLDAGEATHRTSKSYRHIYVANYPEGRPFHVYAGSGKAFYLGNIPQGMVASIALPFDVQAVTIVYGAGDVDDNYLVVFSHETISVKLSGDFF